MVESDLLIGGSNSQIMFFFLRDLLSNETVLEISSRFVIVSDNKMVIGKSCLSSSLKSKCMVLSGWNDRFFLGTQNIPIISLSLEVDIGQNKILGCKIPLVKCCSSSSETKKSCEDENNLKNNENMNHHKIKLNSNDHKR